VAQPEVASGPAVLLADCSEFQPNITDALYLAWSKAIVIRALYGDAHDDKAWYGGQRRTMLHAGGVRFLGVYQFLVAGQSGAAQAQAFHKLVGPIQPGEVFIADFEEGQHSMLSSWYSEMVSLYGQAIRPYLWTYTGASFGQAQHALPVEWIAAYQSSEPSSPHKLWQFTDSYQIPGIGRADCSRFHGTIDQLAALAYKTPAKPTPPPADWVFGPPRDLRAVNVGPNSVKLAWSSPGQPMPAGVGSYQITIREGGQDLPSYPRTVDKTGTSELVQFGSLPPGKTLTALVRALASGTQAHAGKWATVTFKTTAG
jgi:hypothetical protein